MSWSRAATIPKRPPAPPKSAHGGRFVAIPFAFDRSTTALINRIRR
jgi:hypothetical protein